MSFYTWRCCGALNSGPHAPACLYGRASDPVVPPSVMIAALELCASVADAYDAPLHWPNGAALSTEARDAATDAAGTIAATIRAIIEEMARRGQ